VELELISVQDEKQVSLNLNRFLVQSHRWSARVLILSFAFCTKIMDVKLDLGSAQIDEELVLKGAEIEEEEISVVMNNKEVVVKIPRGEKAFKPLSTEEVEKLQYTHGKNIIDVTNLIGELE